LKLNLGCGKLHKDGFVNVDLKEPADELVNLAHEKWPWPDGTIDALEADNLLEHFDNDEFMRFLNEAHRVLKPGGRFWWKVPNALDWPDGAFGDPTHKRYFFPRSFYYIDESKGQWRDYGSHYGFLPWIFAELDKVQDDKFFVCVMTPSYPRK
jgi:SAM-dependent methyltransferase